MTATRRARALAVLGLLAGSAVVFAEAAPQKPAPGSGVDLASLDAAVRPQDDLYRYANNRWLQAADIPADRSSENATTQLFDQAERDVRRIIERLAAEPSRRPGSPAQQVVDLYASMLDEATINARGASPLEPELRAIDAIDSVRALAERAGALSATTVAGPFFLSLTTHPQNPGERVVQISQGGLLLERKDYLQDDDRSRAVREGYQRYLEQIFTLVGRPAASADAAAVLALEISLARAQVVPAPGSTVSSQLVTVARMMTEMPGFDWIAWAKPQGIDRSMTMLVVQPAFFRTFAGTIATVPMATWRAWLAGRYLTAISPNLSEALANPRFEFFGRFLAGQQAPRPRWKRGVSTVNVFLGDAVGRLYVEAHFPRASRSRVERIANQVIEIYREVVSTFDWPATRAKVEAQSAIARLSARVGYPDVWREYRGLVIAPDDLFGNVMRAQRFENNRRMAQGGRPAAAGEWPLPPQTVNAFYNPGNNEVVLPAAILQPPYFDAAADDAVNYGAIGAVIGHEIGHALDDSGRRLPPGFTAEAFNDLVGLQVAWRAYRASLGGRAAPVLDGLTGDRRFFIGWARIWRENVRPEYARQLSLSSPYPTGALRTNGPVSRLQAFYTAFGLAPGDALYLDPARRVY